MCVKRIGLFALLALGCNDVAPGQQAAEGCLPGMSIECECPNGGDGFAVCGEQGRFEACGPCDVGGAGDVQANSGGAMAEPGSLTNTEDGDTSDPDINDAVVDGQVEFTVDSITISPADARVGDVLTCEVFDVQPQTDETYPLLFEWKVNGERVCPNDDLDCEPVDGNTSTLAAPVFKRGDVVTCEVFVTYGGFFHGDIVSEPITIQNTAPAIDAVEIAPADITIGTEMTCRALGIVDADEDEVSLSYTWLANGEPVADSAGYVAMLGVGTEYTCRVTPADESDVGVAQEVSVTVQSTAPTVSNVRVMPNQPGVGDRVTCEHDEAIDADPASVLTIAYAWTINDVPQGGEETSVLSQTALFRDDVIRCSVEVNDGALTSGPVWSDAVVVRNSLPVVEGVSVGPDDVRAGQVLTCRYTRVTDADGDGVISERYRWLINGQPVEGENSADLAGQPFVAGDVIGCEVIVSDGIGESLPNRSNEITVDNTPPSVSAAALMPSDARVSDELRCTAQEVSDVDGQQVDLAYQWLIDDVILDDAAEANLAAATIGKGREVACVLTPNDGMTNGTPFVTDSVTILNTPPEVNTVQVLPLNIKAGDTPRCRYVFVDADNDSDASEISWTVNGLDAGNGAQPVVSLSGGDRVTCTVVPDDGEARGPALSGEAEVANTPPSIGAVVSRPSTPTTRDDVVCEAVDVNDPDRSQSIDVSYVWRVNGTIVATNNGLLPAAETRRGDVLQCTATVKDGVGLPTIAQGEDSTVINSKPTLDAVFIETSPVYPDSEVNCVAQGFRDLDDDADQTKFRWYVDDDVQATTGPRLAGPFNVGAVIRCEAIPFDGLEDGPARIDEVTVENYTALDSRITCLTPMVGEMRAKAGFTITGKVTRPEIITSVRVAFQEAVYDNTTGEFALPIRNGDVAWGLNVIKVEANDANGVSNATFCSFFAADTYAQPDDVFDNTVVLSFTQAAVDDRAPAEPVNSFGDLVRKFIQADEFENLINAELISFSPEQTCLLPACVLGVCLGCAISAGANFTSVALGDNRSASLDLLNNAARIRVRLEDVAISGRAVITGPDFNFTATAASMALSGDFTVRLNNGQLRVSEARNESVTLGEITIEYGNSIANDILGAATSWLGNLFRDDIAELVSGYLFPAFRSQLETALQGLDLEDIGGSFTLPALGGRPATELNLAFGLSSLDLNPSRLRLGLSSLFSGPDVSIHPEPPGVPMPPANALIDALPNSGDMSAAVYLGLINQALFAMWKANVFDIPNLGDALGDEGALFDVGMSLMAPPAVARAGDQVRIHIGPYVGEIPGVDGEEPRVLRGVAYALARLDLNGGEIGVGGPESISIQYAELTIDGVGEDAEGTDEFDVQFRELIQEVVSQALANAIPALPIPSFQVDVPGAGAQTLGIRNPVLRYLNEHMAIDGDFGEIQ